MTHYANGFTVYRETQPPLWMSNGAETFYVGGPNASTDAAGTDYDNPVSRISKATVDRVRTSAGSANGLGDFVYVNVGNYAENVRIVDRDYCRVIGAGIGLCTIKPGDTASTQNTDATGQSQAISVPNESTTIANVAFIIGSRGVVLAGFTVIGTGGTTGANVGVYIGDGGRISSANSWGASQANVYGMFMDGEGGVSGGWGFVFDGFGPGVNVHDNWVTRYRSGGLLINDGGSRMTIGYKFEHNYIIACRGYGVRRSDGYGGGHGALIDNYIMDEGGNVMTNGMLLGTIGSGFGDLVAANHIGTSNTPISVSDAQDRISGNFTSTAGSAAVTYVSMA